MERVVADPSVLVSAIIIRSGNPATIWRAVLDERVELVVCPYLLAELAGVLARPKFRRYVEVEEAESFVAEVARYGRRFPDPTAVPSASRDPADDYLVALMKASSAGFLVSGDRDLTEIHERGIAVLTPRQFVERFL